MSNAIVAPTTRAKGERRSIPVRQEPRLPPGFQPSSPSAGCPLTISSDPSRLRPLLSWLPQFPFHSFYGPKSLQVLFLYFANPRLLVQILRVSFPTGNSGRGISCVNHPV